MSKIVGIDLGTTNSAVAVVDSGIPYVISDADGSRLTPSVVRLPGEDGSPVVGIPARRSRVVYPRDTVYSVKRFMGRRASDVGDDVSVSYPLRLEKGQPVGIATAQRLWSPEQISAEILKHLKAVAEHDLGENVTRAVITVPAYFNDAQRNATIRAGELAGLTVERILNEPTAAALACGLDKLKDHTKVAIYDLGGGTFDLSVLELRQGVFEVLSTNGNTRLGGDDIDAGIVAYLVGLISDRGGPSPDSPEIQARILEAAERAKIDLSGAEKTTVLLPFLTPEFSFEHVMTRAQLEVIAEPVVERTRQHCQRAMIDAGVEFADLDQVILVGGQTRMPLVRQKVSQWFGCSDFDEVRGDVRLGSDFHERKGPLLNTSQNPDEVVALGAAIQGAILAGELTELLLLDVTPLSLGIETFGGLMNVIIPRNSTIPCKAGEKFTNAVENQETMLIHVLQGERERAADNWSLGRFELQFDRGPRASARVGVQFEIDANGVLHVLARDLKTNREQVVAVESAVDVDDAAVQRMVEESVENAFEDLAARRWIETSLRARETLAATRKGIAEYADQLEPDYREQLQSAVSVVEACLTDGEREPGKANPEELRNLVSDLDEATKPLAEHMMEKIMDQMLERQGIGQSTGRGSA